MATLTIRNLPDDVHDALRQQAAEHRRSVEAEVREVLRLSVQSASTTTEQAQAITELREMGKAWRARRASPAGWDDAAASLADRHLEAAWEDGRVSDDERQDWMGRLESYEATAEQVEAFLETRRP